ncbi:hypothetical protein ACF0H5_006279 [Mactra antiquata]
MENELKIYENCAKKLECMNQIPVDSRPKKLSKLKNTLENERKVVYVVDCLSILLQMDFQSVVGKEFVKVYKTDVELDQEIVMFAKEQANKQSKQLFILPCDSTLYLDVIQNVKEWCEKRDEIRVDPMLPSRDLATACLFNSRIDHSHVINALQSIGILEILNDLVFIKYPGKNVMEGLRKSFQIWNKQMKDFFSNKPENYFGRLLKETNDDLQQETIDGINEYCQNAIDNLYPRSNGSSDVMDTDDTSDMTGTSGELKSPVSNKSSTGTSAGSKVFNQPAFLWPVSLQPEVVYILLRLYDSVEQPKNVLEIIDNIHANSDIMYVASPKYALIDIASQHMTDKSRVDRDRHVALNVYMGLDYVRGNNDTTTWLASVLSPPNKMKKTKKDKMAILDEQFSKMNTSTDHVKEQLSNFQQSVLHIAKHMAQSTGNILLYNNSEANKRSEEKLKTFVDTKMVDIRDEFYNVVVKTCLDYETVSIDYLVDLLEKHEYLEVRDDTDRTIQYKKTAHFPSSSIDDKQSEQAFLHYWEMYYKPPSDQDSQQVSGIISPARKRRNDSDGSYLGGKKQKTARVITV